MPLYTEEEYEEVRSIVRDIREVIDDFINTKGIYYPDHEIPAVVRSILVAAIKTNGSVYNEDNN